MSNRALPIPSPGPSSMAVESAEVTEDDTASLSSLFYSCMSTASAIANEHDGANANQVFHGDVEGVAHGLPTSPEHERHTQYKVGMAPSPSHPEIIHCNTARRPPSDSSWSVPSEGERPTVRSITFNRDRTCLLICTSIGVRVRTLESLQLSLQNMDSESELNRTNGNQIIGSSRSLVHDVPLPPDGATYAQLLHSTSLLAVVKPSSPRCCYLFNTKNASSPLAVLPLSAAVKRVELQRNVLAAMTVDLRLHVFHLTGDGSSCVNGHSIDRRHGIEPGKLRPMLITTLNIMHPSDSPRNTRGIDGFNAGAYFDLSPGEEEYLICKSFNGSPGTIRVYDPTIVHTLPSGNVSVASEGVVSTECSWDMHNSVTARKKVKRRIHFITSIDAHDHSVTRMLIGWGGRNKQPSSYLATTSCHGTRIRVFGLPKGENLWDWHRGSKACDFYSLSWNGIADRLAAHGSSGTIHVFEWQKENPPVVAEHDDVDEGSRQFDSEHETKNGQPRATPDDRSLASEKSKPFFHRFASSIKRHTLIRNNPSTLVKHRSFAKLKYKSSASSASSNSNAVKTQALVLSLLNRNHDIYMKDDTTDIEDTLVVCSLDGELRRYLVKKSQLIELTHVEDVLSRG